MTQPQCVSSPCITAFSRGDISWKGHESSCECRRKVRAAGASPRNFAAAIKRITTGVEEATPMLPQEIYSRSTRQGAKLAKNEFETWKAGALREIKVGRHDLEPSICVVLPFFPASFTLPTIYVPIHLLPHFTLAGPPISWPALVE